jgi:hypothetical protein
MQKTSFPTLKMEPASSSEIFVVVHHTARRSILEDTGIYINTELKNISVCLWNEEFDMMLSSGVLRNVLLVRTDVSE